ncbi:PLDc N-terminal domain-containing protein [Rothia mucilaginosa]|uniref:PLDc N-terminal domain-containing protein n=1 Tax=Rothia mucilaginosa TaxID=43675 RepID=UPI0025E462E9|nr:PLDc N-terminal domain-containing protein [Rothia mucilaginosa]
MDWRAVLELVVTVVFLAGIALALLCLVTIHRNPHFSEVQKLKWLLLVLCLPYVGPVTWLLRARLERIDRERAEQERMARGSAAASGGASDSAPDSASDSASESLSDTPTTTK